MSRDPNISRRDILILVGLFTVIAAASVAAGLRSRNTGRNGEYDYSILSQSASSTLYTYRDITENPETG